MIQRCLGGLALVVSLAVAAAAMKDEAAGGIIYGEGHAYYIKAPTGWIFDNESGVNQGVHAVIYPKGSSWKSSPVVVYSGATGKEELKTLEGVIQDDLKNFQQNSPGVVVDKRPSLQTTDGHAVEVRYFHGDRYGNLELVAYIDTPKVVCEIIMSARDNTVFEQGRPAFESVVKSFHLVSDTVSH